MSSSVSPGYPNCRKNPTSTPAPPAQPHTVSPLSMVAVSPDGKYLAGYSPEGKSLVVWAANQAKPVMQGGFRILLGRNLALAN